MKDDEKRKLERTSSILYASSFVRPSARPRAHRSRRDGDGARPEEEGVHAPLEASSSVSSTNLGANADAPPSSADAPSSGADAVEPTQSSQSPTAGEARGGRRASGSAPAAALQPSASMTAKMPSRHTLPATSHASALPSAVFASDHEAAIQALPVRMRIRELARRWQEHKKSLGIWK